MNDQQRIDHLNTIINQYESLVWLREVFKDVAKYREAMGHQEADLKALEDACVARKAELAGLDKKYHAKVDELELDLGETKQHYADMLDEATEKFEKDIADLTHKQEVEIDRLAIAQKDLATVQAAIQEGLKKQKAVENSLAKAMQDYEDYKASLR